MGAVAVEYEETYNIIKELYLALWFHISEEPLIRWLIHKQLECGSVHLVCQLHQLKNILTNKQSIR